MTGKVINSSAAGLLILILPFAFLSVLLYKAWPELLALFVIIVGFRIWQQYQWKQWSKQVNPFFNELIRENQGCLTALDLSLKANLSGSAAQRYLDKKAEEFGAQRRDYQDKGTVYYFLTANALGSIFEDSEPELELESESFISTIPTLPEPVIEAPTLPEPVIKAPTLPEPVIEAPTLPEPVIEKESHPSLSKSSISELLEPPEASEKEEVSSSHSAFSSTEIETALEPMPTPQQEQAKSLDEKAKSLDEKQDLWVDVPKQEQSTLQALIQAELAKRLDVHSSTVGKRKSDPDFPEWSQSRDPEGIAWIYSPETKEFLPTENPPPLEE
jgi:hypothetical protein